MNRMGEGDEHPSSVPAATARRKLGLPTASVLSPRGSGIVALTTFGIPARTLSVGQGFHHYFPRRVCRTAAGEFNRTRLLRV